VHFSGEVIALKPENSGKVTAAVAEMLRSIQSSSHHLQIHDRIVELDKRSTAIIEEIARNQAMMLIEARLPLEAPHRRQKDRRRYLRSNKHYGFTSIKHRMASPSRSAMICSIVPWSQRWRSHV
jgi:hypothetical protein